MSPLFGSVEAGGTKFKCAVGSGAEDLKQEIRIPTKDPITTLGSCIEFFHQQQSSLGKLSALGIGCFGPIDLNSFSPTYGFIKNTPKPEWSNTNILGPLKKAFQVPMGFETDVNCAALGEWRWGYARGLDTFIYLTVGTGIGGGGMARGKLLRGLLHPEMGHLLLPKDGMPDPFPGSCPFHGACWEGLASGSALQKRWHKRPEELDQDHEAWLLESHYLALGLTNLILALSPQKIILGGGVMQQTHLFPMIRSRVLELLHDYLESPNLQERIDNYIVPPRLGSRSGILGGFALAELALENQKQETTLWSTPAQSEGIIKLDD